MSVDVLSYRTPAHSRETSEALPATLLMLPGICGWVLLIGALGFQSRIAWAIGPGIGLIIWITAVCCAIASFNRFRRLSPRPWYVQLCLVCNLIGIMFTITPIAWIVFSLALASLAH